jgi:tetraacyldisaccharide 4'-kinase
MSAERDVPFRERVWRRDGALPVLVHLSLRPLSAAFALGARAKSLLYRLRLRRGARTAAAVVSVGNLSVGGTGKTPTALWLAHALVARGHRVAIVSRGHGGRRKEATVVGPSPGEGIPASDDWQEVGDEAVLLARRFGGPVVIARRRADAVRLAERAFGIDVAVLDDGFQHRRLARDFDLVLVRADELDARVTLPAGSLREPRSALRRADAILVTKGELPEAAEAALRRFVGDRPIHRGEIRVSALVTPLGGHWEELPMGKIAARRALAIVGVGHPQSFYEEVHEWDTRIEDFLEYPDHHAYSLEDWKKISLRSRELELVVTTEKDLVKLERFPFAKEKLVALRVSMDVVVGEALLDRIEERIAARASARARS